MKINSLSPQSNNFLQIITTIALVPKKLYFIGNLPTERRPTVAIVGTRKPSTYGKEVTYKIAYELAKRGVVIVSGLALGVDAIAHRAALDAGGTTIAVLANGLPAIQPATNRQIGEDIVAKGGAIITEYPPDTDARVHHFLARNRIVSGLSDATIITEAAAKSGTLNTAGHTLEQGRELCVVPGNITSPLSAGCNHLLKQGAHPITSAQDILEIIAPDLLQPQTQLALGDNPLQTQILQLIQSGTRDGDELQRLTKLPVSTFSTELTMLELNGMIRSLGGNQWTVT